MEKRILSAIGSAFFIAILVFNFDVNNSNNNKEDKVKTMNIKALKAQGNSAGLAGSWCYRCKSQDLEVCYILGKWKDHYDCIW